MTYSIHLPTKFPALQAMDILIKIEMALAGNENNVIAIGLKAAIKDNLPAAKIITEVKEMIEDNPDAIADILGNELMTKIKFF